jgi:hypothetical protein
VCLAITYIKGFNRNQAVLIPEAIVLLIDKTMKSDSLILFLIR